jgi:hypothetical protein
VKAQALAFDPERNERLAGLLDDLVREREQRGWNGEASVGKGAWQVRSARCGRPRYRARLNVTMRRKSDLIGWFIKSKNHGGMMQPQRRTLKNG